MRDIQHGTGSQYVIRCELGPMIDNQAIEINLLQIVVFPHRGNHRT